MVLWQIKAKFSGGPSQAEALASLNVKMLFNENLKAIWAVFSQNIFSGTLIVKGVQEYASWMLIVFIITITGLIVDLIRKNIFSLYFIFVILILMVGNTAFQAPVLSRYLLVFTPLFIYFFYLGIVFYGDLISKKSQLGKYIAILVLPILLMSSFKGDAYNVQKAHMGYLYSPAYNNFIECAKWAKDNLPKDAVVASRKERIFYVFSGLRGFKHTGYRDVYSKEFENKKLEQFAKLNTDYLILDTFNGSTIQNVFPIVENNQDKFTLIKVIGNEQEGPCYVLKVNKWWLNKTTK